MFDEPSNGLDHGGQLRLLARMRRLAQAGHGVLFTTHHPDHARQAADRVALLAAGRIDADGAPAEVLTEAAVAGLYGLNEDEQRLLSCALTSLTLDLVFTLLFDRVLAEEPRHVSTPTD